jgi:hypothetical protein
MCGNCNRIAAVTPASKVLTSRFGSWDDIAVCSTGGRWLCEPCAWTYMDVGLRRAPYLISSAGAGRFVDQEEVQAMLSNPIGNDVALLFPVGGKRIVAPRAQWGRVAVDHAALTWSRRHATALAAAVELRGYGFGEKSLAESSPPFHVLLTVPVEKHPQVQALWRVLRETREDKTMCPTILKMSRLVA